CLIAHGGRLALRENVRQAGAPAYAVALQMDVVADRGRMAILLQQGHALAELIREDEDARRRPLQDVGRLAPVEAPVQGGVDGAELAAGKEEVEMLDAVA